MKKKIISFIVALALAIPIFTGVVPTLSEGAAEDVEISKYPVKINEENFPDENFRNYVLEEEKRIAEENGEESDESLSEEEVAKFTEIHVDEKEIESLKGIEYFTELTTLVCDKNKLTELKLSGYSKLKSLSCKENLITDLDCSENPSLQNVWCEKNQLSFLNTSGCANLLHLYCNDNQLTYIDLSDNIKLKRLNCQYNQLTFLDLSQNTELIKEDGLEYYSDQKTEKVSCADLDDYLYNLNERLPEGFDINKASNWSIEPDENNIIHFNNLSLGAEISYEYDSGNSQFGKLEFKIKFLSIHKLIEAQKSDSLCFTFPKLYVCEECNNYFLEGEALITGSEWIKDSHNYGEWTVKKEPTCSENGIKIRTCMDCGYTEYDIIAMTDHTFVDGEYECNYCQHWKECTECGREFGREYHDVDPLTNACTVCGKNFDHYHNFEFVPEKAPTCTEDGMMAHFYCAACRMYYFEDLDGHVDEISREDLIIEKTGHQYELKHDDDQHWEECIFCGDKQETEAHEFDDGDVIKETTCVDGLIRYTCICGYQYDEIIPGKGEHSFTVCEYLDEKQHVLVCAVCGEKSELAEDHEYDIEVVQPSCFESGKMIHTCKDCGYKYQEISGAPTGNHSFSAEFNHNSDFHWHECETEGCTAIDSREEHTWDNGEITIPPTVDNPGVRIYTCTECEAEKSEWVERLDPPEKDPDETDTTEKDPSESDPIVTDPSESDPTVTDPSESDPTVTDPSESDPAVTDPSESDPAVTEPSESDPAVTDPTGSDPAATDSSSREPDDIISDTTTSTDKTPSVVNPDNDGNNKGDNMETGLIISLIPAAVAGVSVVIFKKRNRK